MPVYEGKSPLWYVWFLQRDVPQDWSRVCCLCGKRGIPSESFLHEFGRILLKGVFERRAITDDLTQASGRVLFPYHPHLEDGEEARAIVAFFGDRELRACAACAAPDPFAELDFDSGEETDPLSQFMLEDDDEG